MDFGTMSWSEVSAQLDDGHTAYKMCVENGRARIAVDGVYGGLRNRKH